MHVQLEVVFSRTDILRVKDRELNVPLRLPWQAQASFGGDRPMVDPSASAAQNSAAVNASALSVAAAATEKGSTDAPPPLNAQLSLMLNKPAVAAP